MTFEKDSGLVGDFEGDASPEYVRKAVEDSLSRLETDYIDLYQLHLNTSHSTLRLKPGKHWKNWSKKAK